MPEPQLDLALARWGLAGQPCRRLAGDVSHRRYYRLDHPTDGAETVVAMVTPPDEAGKMHDWIAIGDYLHRHGVPVPRVGARDDGAGVLLVTDVGDRLLTEVHDHAEADAWYRRVLRDLARIECAAAGEPSAASPAHGRRLEEQRIRWELRRFRKVVAAPVRDLTPTEQERWKQGEDALVAGLTGAPQAWMHRDLHARNLLVHHDRVWWIDFQDAMIGPWQYDLASLLLDPYAALSPTRREALRGDYLALPGRVHRDLTDRAADTLYDLCAVQRLVHCIACYVWVCDQLGRDTYVCYLPHALDELRRSMAVSAAAAPLSSVMERRWDGIYERWCRDTIAA